MTERFAVFCKSFHEDFDRLQLLLDSAAAHAPDYPFILSIPGRDAPVLADRIRLPAHTTVIHDEDYTPSAATRMHGWTQQQVCKLSIHRTGLADSFLAVDSDSYFIAPLDRGDFMHGAKRRIVYSSVYTGFHAHNGRLIDYIGNQAADPERDRAIVAPLIPGSVDGFAERLAAFRTHLAETADTTPIKRGPWIRKLFLSPALVAVQPGQILHATLLADMEAFFASHGLSLVELIGLVPWEYDWYGCWASAARMDQVARSVSPIIHFAATAAVDHARTLGLTTERLARRFRIIQMAARHFDTLAF